jgi:hypothetical protein
MVEAIGQAKRRAAPRVNNFFTDLLTREGGMRSLKGSKDQTPYVKFPIDNIT